MCKHDRYKDNSASYIPLPKEDLLKEIVDKYREEYVNIEPVRFCIDEEINSIMVVIVPLLLNLSKEQIESLTRIAESMIMKNLR
jgi:hypothetical protein